MHVDAPPEVVYEYFTKPDAMVRWMGDYALLDARAGGELEIDVRGAPVRGRYLELDPPRLVVLSWGYAGSDALPPGASTVEIRLTAEGSGTRVALEHRDLPADDVPGHSSGWVHYLDRLSLAATGTDPGADPGHA